MKQKRIVSLLLSLTLCLSLLSPLPLTVQAATVSVSKQAVMPAKDSPLGYDTATGTSKSYDRLYFGTCYDDMETENAQGKPYEWRILDGKTNIETDGLFLLSMKLYSGVRFTLPREGTENWWLDPHNSWTSSTCAARIWCAEMATSEKVFSAAEQGAILVTNKADETYNSTGTGYFNATYGRVHTGALNGDKVFFLSAKEFEDSRYALTTSDLDIGSYMLRTGVDGSYTVDDVTINDGLIATMEQIRSKKLLTVLRIYSKQFTGTAYSKELTATEKFFLDSAMDFGFFPSVLPNGAEDTYEYVYNELTARPAMNLDGSKLLYLMKADNTGHTTFGKIADASDNREWKATLLNSDDTAFKDGITLGSVPENNLFDAGNRTMTINHPELNTLTGGYNTITAALLDKDGKLVCYGSVSTDMSATSTEITIPDALSDGTYTLRINAEQWNGEKLTDLAAQPYEMSITTAGVHEHFVCGNSDYCTDNHTNVFWTPVTSTADMAAMKADGYYFLTGDIAAPETDCVGHLCTNGNTVTGTLKVGTDGLTVCSCKGRDSISDDIETVAVAAGGTYDQYGSFVGNLRAGNNSTLNIRRGAWRKLGPTSTSAARAYICQENGEVPLGEGTTLSIYQGDLYKKGDGDLKLPKNCKIHAYTSTLGEVDTTNEGSEVFLHLGSRIETLRLGRAGNSCTIEEDGTVSTLTMAEGSTITVPNNAKITTVKEVTASSAITVEDGGKLEKAETVKAGAAITIEDGGTLGTVENAEAGSVINLHRCTAGAISSDGTLNLCGAVSGATFTVSKPLNICTDLGEKPEKTSVIDVMNAGGTPRLTDGVFTGGWNTYMVDADPGDYFTTPTSYKITKTVKGELRCEKRYHEPGAHPVCGAACTHSGTHTGVTWEKVTEWGGDGLALSNSTYYLENDVKRSASGGTIKITGTVNICLNGYTLDLNGSHFEVESGAVLNICDCAGTGKVTNGSGTKGGGVYLSQGGTFNLYGGELSGNTADTSESKGGAVYVNGGTFTMDGGTISQTIPVEVNAGTFNFKGGSLSGHQYRDAAIWQTGGAVSMTGGTISGNSPLYLSGGTFTMTGGSMTTRHEISVSGGTLNINGGSIVTAQYALVLESGTVSMTAGRLAGRTAAEIKGGTFNMSGGTIEPNTAAENNWYGVKLTGGTFNMSGGEIRDWPLGCGVEVSSGTTFKVSGTAKITDNTYSGSYGYKAARNVYLETGAKMTVDTMNEGAAIGVTMEDKTGVFTAGGKDCSAYFTSDDTDYTVEADSNNLKLSTAKTQPVVNKILVDGVEAEKDNDGNYFLTLNLGESVTLSAELTPADTEFRWYHNSSFCAKLTSNGVITGVEKSYVYSNGQPVYKTLYAVYKETVLKELKVAVVEPTSYTVTYDMQGHGDQIAPLTAAPNEIMTAPNAPGAKGYTFGGWYKDAACTAEWDFAADKVTSKVTLYAKWTAKSYSMTLNANGGECSETSVLLTYGESCGTLPTPTRSGHTFNGWYDADGTKLEAETVLNKDYPETQADRTLTARWTVKPATAPEVTEGNGLSLTYGYAAGSSISVTAAPAEGHSITGYQWYTCNADGGNATAIEGAASAAYAIETGKTAGTYYYYCAVTAKRTDNSETAVKNSDVITVAVSQSGATMSASANKSEYTYGETVKITVSGITPTGIAPIGLFSLTTPTTNQVAFWNGDTQLTEPQTVTGDTLTFYVTGLTVGDYTLTAKFTGNDNMAATSVGVSISIKQAEPNYTTPTGLTATYGDTLANVSLPTGWAWVTKTDSVGNAGTQIHKAIFTPTDTTNYKAITVDVSVEVAKASINRVSLDIAPNVYGATPTTFPTWNTGYKATVAWDPTDAKFGFNTAYTATVTLTADSNHRFADGISVDDWSRKSESDDVLTFERTFEKTRKEELYFLVIEPVSQTLDEYCADVSAVIEKLPSNVTYQTETGASPEAAIEWSCGRFDSAVGAQNTFTWSVKSGELSNYSNNVNLATTGSITVTNASAVSVTHTKNDKEITYNGTTYDVSQMFTKGTTTGTVTYEVVSGGTGNGMLNGKMLTITKAGTIYIKMSTAADKQYAASDITATLTVNKADGTGTVSMIGWTYGNGANIPTVTSATNGTENVSYQYKGVNDNTYSDVVPSNAGNYTVKATFAATDLYNEASATADFTIDRIELTPSISGTVSKVYDGTSDVPSGHSLTIALSGIVNNDGVSATASFAYGGANVGTTEIKATGITLTGGKSANYKLSVTEATANVGTITKADSSVATVPTENILTYNGTVQELVTSGTANGGTLKYSLDNEIWTETIPTGTDATSYEVWYKVFGDNNHNDTNANKIDVTIAKKSIADATVALDGELTYNGQKQTQKVTVTLDGFTNVTFDIFDNEQIDVKTEGDYTLTVTANGNFEGTRTLDWNIKPYTPTENPDNKTTARVKRGRTLAEAAVTNGEILGLNDMVLEGDFTWADDTTETVSADCIKQMTFMPTDTNYAPITVDVAVSTYSSGGGSFVTRYTVKFNTNGGSTVISQTVKKNGTVTEPKEPTKDGYIFDGWYTDSKFANEYDFDTKVTKNITLYAKWVEDEVQNPSDDKNDDDKNDNRDDSNIPTPDEWKNPFDDVKDNEWYFDNVRYANENGLVSGTTDTTFAPNDNLTRAMLVTVLYRVEGEPEANKSIPFADVMADSYYANAVIWAEQNGIVKGVSETEFAPDENITREQIATIIYRYAKLKGYDVSVGEDTNILSYTDANEISEYATEAMQYAVGSGLIKGKTETTLNPQDNATRAEIAAILQRFIEGNK